MDKNPNLRWVDYDPVLKTEPARLSVAERVAKQRQANFQASEQSWDYLQSPEIQERNAKIREETLSKRKRFAKSALIPDLSADVGEKVEPISNIFGKYASFAVPIEYTPELGAAAGTFLSKIGGTALAEFEGLAMRVASTAPAAAVAMAIFYSPKTADGTLYGDTEIYDLKSVKTNVRLGVSPSGLVPYGYHVNGTAINTVGVIKDGAKFVAYIEEGLTIEWVPITEEEAGHNILVSPIPKAIEQHNIYVHPEADQGQLIDGISITPIAETDIKDCILTFPIGSGIPPIYIVYTSPRDLPGTSSGSGKDVEWDDGYWLGEASDKGQGQYIPTDIAKALDGKQFDNFAEYQSAFWKAVYAWVDDSTDPKLKAQFSRWNMGQMKNGNAPFVGKDDYAWGEHLNRYVLHHKIQIQHNGDVYNADNIRVATPGLHWGEIHGSKRVGKKGNVLKNEK